MVIIQAKADSSREKQARHINMLSFCTAISSITKPNKLDTKEEDAWELPAPASVNGQRGASGGDRNQNSSTSAPRAQWEEKYTQQNARVSGELLLLFPFSEEGLRGFDQSQGISFHLFGNLPRMLNIYYTNNCLEA